jgi:S-methylmethionine-dependent homocysteine/selenocysteine methylase
MLSPQNYPRLEGPGRQDGLLDDSQLPAHVHKIPYDELKEVIKDAIARAEQKSSRQILGILDSVTEEEKIKIYKEKGKKLFEYFRRYYGDPATTAFDCIGKHFSDIAKEQFRNQTLQKERMNSGWRYQYIAKDCAVKSQRFLTVSDIGAAEADFNATLSIVGDRKSVLNIYVSIKNRASITASATFGRSASPDNVVCWHSMALQ